MQLCKECKKKLGIRVAEPMKLQVLKSQAGHYIGRACGECGPYSIESCYYSTRSEAQTDLDSGIFHGLME